MRSAASHLIANAMETARSRSKHKESRFSAVIPPHHIIWSGVQRRAGLSGSSHFRARQADGEVNREHGYYHSCLPGDADWKQLSYLNLHLGDDEMAHSRGGHLNGRHRSCQTLLAWDGPYQ